jgi:uncharacterized protein (DUF305 family)
VVLLTAALLTSGCGGGGPTATATAGSTKPASGHNAADVMFLQMLVPHHRQGLAIVRLARDRPLDRDVRQLADAIESTQASEVKTMAGWLRKWGEPPTAPADSHAGHGGMPQTSEAAIKALAKTPDAKFQREFLNLLIAHQDDAIQIARLELRTGRAAAARRLARQVDRSRTAQIKQMLAWLG